MIYEEVKTLQKSEKNESTYLANLRIDLGEIIFQVYLLKNMAIKFFQHRRIKNQNGLLGSGIVQIFQRWWGETGVHLLMPYAASWTEPVFYVN